MTDAILPRATKRRRWTLFSWQLDEFADDTEANAGFACVMRNWATTGQAHAEASGVVRPTFDNAIATVADKTTLK